MLDHHPTMRPSPLQIDEMASDRVEAMKIEPSLDKARAHQAWMAFYAWHFAQTEYGRQSAKGHLIQALAMIEDTVLTERVLREQLEAVSPVVQDDYRSSVASRFERSSAKGCGEPQLPITAPGFATRSHRRPHSYRRIVAIAVAGLLLAVGLCAICQPRSPGPRESLTAWLLRGAPPTNSIPPRDAEEDPPTKSIIVEHQPNNRVATENVSLATDIIRPEPDNQPLVDHEPPEVEILPSTSPKTEKLPAPPRLTVQDFTFLDSTVFSHPQPQITKPVRDHQAVVTIISNNNVAGNEGPQTGEEDYLSELNRVEAVSGPDSYKTSKSLGRFAGYCMHERKFQKAAGLYERQLEILEQLKDIDPEEIRACILQLAESLVAAKRCQQASELLEPALASYESQLKHDDGDIAWCREVLAKAYLQQGRFDEAATLFGKVLTAQEGTVAIGGDEIARRYDNYALANLGLGKIGVAKLYFNRACQLRTSSEPAAAASYSGLGLVAVAEQDYEGARNYFAKSLEIIAEECGEGDILTATCYDNLAKVHLMQGERAVASRLLRQALLIREKVLGPMDPDTLATRQLLEKLTCAQNKNEIEKAVKRNTIPGP